MMHALVEWAGTAFDSEAYLFWTRIQCLLWSGADIIIIVYLARIANIARTLHGKPPHGVLFWGVGFTALFVPAVVVAPDGTTIFLLELCITVPHFLMILYLIGANLSTFKQFLTLITKQTT